MKTVTIDKGHEKPVYTLESFEKFLKTEAGKKLSPEEIEKIRASFKQAKKPDGKN